MNVIGIIPARGGSRRIPGKNIKPLGGKPLLLWTIDAARKASWLRKLVVSTEDHAIAAAARGHEAEVVDRPPELATDQATLYPVMLHVLDSIQETFDYVVLLHPTSPFRTAEDIDGCFDACLASGADACVSFAPRQKQPNAAVYVGKVSWLRAGGNFDDPRNHRFEMPFWRSLDIDTQADWDEAEFLAGRMFA